MWEITLVGEECDYIYFSQLRDMIVGLNLGAFVSIGLNDKLYISIAAKYNILDKIQDVLYETIIKINKKEFLTGKLDFIGDNDIYDDFILTSIIYLDLPQEIEFAKYSTKLSDMNHIRSLFYFRLNKLLPLWHNMAKELNLSIKKNKKETIYLDFLKFLADATEPAYDIVYLGGTGTNLSLYDNQNKQIKVLSSVDEIDIIVNLIIFSPKKIVVNKAESISDRLCNLLRYIFIDRVSLVL